MDGFGFLRARDPVILGAISVDLSLRNHGKGITEGICSSIFPLSSSLSLLDFSSPDDAGGQFTGENVWRLHSVVPCASKLGTITKYPSNAREMTEIHLNDRNGDLIY